MQGRGKVHNVRLAKNEVKIHVLRTETSMAHPNYNYPIEADSFVAWNREHLHHF